MTPPGLPYAPAPCPFTLTVDPMAAMLNTELADDPHYAGIEVQRFDDPAHGTGIAVLLVRRADRRTDVYRQAGLRLDPGAYGISAGLGEWCEAAFEPARLEVTPTGTLCDVGFADAAGRRVEVHVDDRGGPPRSTGALLAPVSAAIEQPASMLVVWMPDFDLLHATGERPRIVIDGREASTGRLPAGWLHRRLLIKVAADVVIVQLNPAHDGPLGPAAGWDGTVLGAAAAGHRARLVLDPPLPELLAMVDGVSATGGWHLDIDTTPAIVGGTWSARRQGTVVELGLDSTAPWRPGPLPLLMRIVTRMVPTFRTWPTTYRWRAILRLSDPPTLTSRWERTGPKRDGAYGRAMGLADDGAGRRR